MTFYFWERGKPFSKEPYRGTNQIAIFHLLLEILTKGQLKTEIEALKRRLRLKQIIKDDVSNINKRVRNCYEFGPTFNIKTGWNPPRADLILEPYLSLLEKEVLSISPEGKKS